MNYINESFPNIGIADLVFEFATYHVNYFSSRCWKQFISLPCCIGCGRESVSSGWVDGDHCDMLFNLVIMINYKTIKNP